MERTDAKLVAAAKAGDASAVAELFRRYFKKARAAAYGVTGDAGAADDAASEGLQAAFAKLSALRDPSRFAPWLHRIVVRIARRGRRESREVVKEEPVGNEVEDPRQEMERREFALWLRARIDRLAATLREALALHYFEGYAIEDIARFLDVPAGTVKSGDGALQRLGERPGGTDGSHDSRRPGRSAGICAAKARRVPEALYGHLLPRT